MVNEVFLFRCSCSKAGWHGLSPIEMVVSGQGTKINNGYSSRGSDFTDTFRKIGWLLYSFCLQQKVKRKKIPPNFSNSESLFVCKYALIRLQIKQNSAMYKSEAARKLYANKTKNAIKQKNCKTKKL